MNKAIATMVTHLERQIKTLKSTPTDAGVEIELFYDNDECQWWYGWSSVFGYDGDWFDSIGEVVSRFIDNPPTANDGDGKE